MNGTTAYVLSKKFTTDTAASLGSLKGAPCTVGNVTTDILGNTVVELKWENNAGVSQTMNVTIAKGIDGLYVTSANIDVDNHLVLTLSDLSTIDAGEMPQAKVEISKDSGNAIENKADGLFVAKTGVVISPNTGNILSEKTNGLYVPETDLKDYAKTADVVAKETGKGLSSNDFTDSQKTKLDNMVADAQKNVQADWNESNPTSDAFILNKPTIPDSVAISKDADNQLVEGSDKGLFVAKCPVDNALSTTSENPVQNKLVAEALDKKVEKETGKGLSSNDFTNDIKEKVDNLPTNDQITQELAKKVDIQQDILDKGKALVVGEDGKLILGEVATDGLEVVRLTKADYEALSETEKNDKTKLYDVYDEESLNLTDYATKKYVDDSLVDKASGVYSTDEVEIGTYMGKPLYRKCIIVEGTSSQGKIAFNNIKGLAPNYNVISLTGTLDTLNDGQYTFPVPYTLIDTDEDGNLAWYRLYTYYDNTTGAILFDAKSSVSAYYKGKFKLKLIAEYTKTTD